MKRDMDLIRAVLLAVEEAERYPVFADSLVEGLAWEAPTVKEHVRLLCDGGYLTPSVRKDAHTGGTVQDPALVLGMSWAGHDFIETVRDPAVWRKTKDVSAKAGGFTVDLLKDIAVGFIRTQVVKHTGVELAS